MALPCSHTSASLYQAALLNAISADSLPGRSASLNMSGARPLWTELCNYQWIDHTLPVSKHCLEGSYTPSAADFTSTRIVGRATSTILYPLGQEHYPKANQQKSH